MTTYRTATRAEVLDLLKEDRQNLRQRGAHLQEHWREGRLLFDWTDQTIQAIEQHEAAVTDAMVSEWRSRRSAVFRLPLVLSRTCRHRADIVIKRDPTTRSGQSPRE